MDASTRPGAVDSLFSNCDVSPQQRNSIHRTHNTWRWKVPLRCSLCGEAIEIQSNFRVTHYACPQCGLSGIFEPQKCPLPVEGLRGLRLRFAEVEEAQEQGARRDVIPWEEVTAAVPRSRRWLRRGMIVLGLLAAVMTVLARVW